MAGLTPLRRILKVFHPEGIPGPGAAIYNAISSADIFQRNYEMIASDILDYCAEGSLLDIGTGPAWLLVKLHARSPRMQLTGMDASAAMVARARANMEAAGLAGRISVIQGNVSHLPFRDETFDIAVSTGSIHHWKDPTAGLDEVHRVLKAGEYALVYDVVSDTPRSVIDEAGREFGRLKTLLFWLHGFEEPFYSQAALGSLAGPTLFREGCTRPVGILCCLTMRKARAEGRGQATGDARREGRAAEGASDRAHGA
jgi:SAM-dependent methyltransferase